MKIQGSGALVTGGASGIGKAICEALLERGGKVCVLDIDAKLGNQTVEELQARFGQQTAFFRQCDVTDKDQLKGSFYHAKEVLGTLDIVANNAGHICETAWERTIDINLTAVYSGCLIALELMRKDKGHAGGVVVNTGSLAGLVEFGIAPVYGATKHAVVGLTRSLAADRNYPTHGVRFNCLCPTFTDTPFIDVSTYKRDQFFDYDWVVDVITSVPKVSAGDCAKAFVDLVENDGFNGTVMHVANSGVEVVDQPKVLP